jgi:hypothetical protein
LKQTTGPQGPGEECQKSGGHATETQGPIGRVGRPHGVVIYPSEPQEPSGSGGYLTGRQEPQGLGGSQGYEGSQGPEYPSGSLSVPLQT